MKKLLLLLTTAMLSLSAYAEEPESKPLTHIETDCIFTYHFAYVYLGATIYQKSFRFVDKTIGDTAYTAMIECDAKGDYVDDAKVVAYLREEDNKVYMLLGNYKEPGWMRSEVYGLKDKETMIYDYSLKPEETYRIGELSDYIPMPNNLGDIFRWYVDNWEEGAPYSYLCLWNYGELTLREKRFDKEMQRDVWTLAQRYFDPDRKYSYGTDLNYEPVPWDYDGWRTFDVIDGFGCMQSLLPFPGLFPPCPNIFTGDFTAVNPVLCKVERLGTKEVLFERTDLPLAPHVELTDADLNEVPRYYNLQGVELQEPQPGSICIVRRGNRATKELIRR